MQESISETSSQLSSEQRVAALRGTMVSLMVLEIFNDNLEELRVLLEKKASSAPDFFGNAPLLLDFNKLNGEVDIYWLEEVRKILLDNNFIPVGITGGDNLLEEAARATSVAVWPSKESKEQSVAILDEPEVVETEPYRYDSQEEITQNIGGNNDIEEITVEEISAPPESSLPMEEKEAEEGVAELESSPQPESESDTETDQTDKEHTEATQDATVEKENVETMVIRQPVRSGQKIFAKGRDLIVMAQVSTGAEIIADGHIHVYGPLRGRAIAGANGKEDARIFCQDLQADLVAIAGIYATNDDLPEDKLRQAVQIFLQDEQLKINSL